jgi:zinc transport system substrate-binding protein
VNRFYFGAVLAFVLCLASGCQPARELADAPRVVATIPPLAMLAQEVRGDAAAVSSFLPPGANPHQFEPRPSDVRRAAQASVVMQIGLEFDDWVLELLKEVGSEDVAVVRGADVVELLPLDAVEVTEDEHSDSGDMHRQKDPHFWLDPVAASQLVIQLGEALAKEDPAQAEAYRERARQKVLKLEQLDEALREELAPLRGTRFIATHAGWAYFARRYGLEQVAVVELAPGRAPGPRTLSRLVALARQEKVQAIFSEVQLSDGSARVLASELELPVIALDPMGGAGVQGREQYEDLLRWNSQRLLNALAPTEL